MIYRREELPQRRFPWNTLILAGLACFAVLFLPPWAAAVFAGDAGMAVSMALFYAVDPLFAGLLGRWAGRQGRVFWFLPLLCSGMFLVGVWASFTVEEPLFLLYAGAYLAIGYLCYGLARRKKRREREPPPES